MIIVHYIPTMALSSGIVPEYVNILMRSTERMATSHIVTQSDMGNAKQTFAKNFAKQLQLLQPDIVHIHAVWDVYAALAEAVARHYGFFTVVSPHGMLSMENMELNFWKEKLPKILLFQKRMVQKSAMLVVTTQQELEDMNKLKWNPNIAFVPHPLVSGLSEDETASLIMAAYRKVLDTHYAERMSIDEEGFINRCLWASVQPEEVQMPEKDELPVVSTLSFRRIYIYAYDNEVVDMMIAGAKRLQMVTPPVLDVPNIPRFRYEKPQNKRELKKYNTLASLMNKVIAGADVPENSERVNMKVMLSIYRNLRFRDYDEDLFCRQLRDKGIRKWCSGLMSTLHDMFDMELGYMPLLPKNDKKLK